MKPLDGFSLSENRKSKQTLPWSASEFLEFGSISIPVYVGEFWTAKQRDGHSLHEVSYRACYKPQLPDYFISRYAGANCVVFDPFLGRGTTLIQARLRGCHVVGSDVNPLCLRLTKPRLCRSFDSDDPIPMRTRNFLLPFQPQDGARRFRRKGR